MLLKKLNEYLTNPLVLVPIESRKSLKLFIGAT